MRQQQNRKPNSLIQELSPYLLQHAYNPVNWYPFSEDVFRIARNEDKPLLISVGYSACHWCHVMAHECFEDDEVAAFMNRHFINVKVDREERSDVDMIYMQAVQLMTGHGGWPLNCFVLPDGRPFYGGTYFPKAQWMHILQSLASLYQNDRDKVVHYASELTNGVAKVSLVEEPQKVTPVTADLLKQCVSKWKPHLDQSEGGQAGAPKFPMPSNYRFLLRYAVLEEDDDLLKHVRLTLTKMACGGIYDQLRGGFARYSTDPIWKVPHFEKMLYDNAQLVSLYTEAYLFTHNSLYRQTVIETLDFVESEWLNEAGFFYSAFDADSEGEEGKYYTWSKDELRFHLKRDYDAFIRYFDVNERGYWEDDRYILMRTENLAKAKAELHMSADELEKTIERCKEKLRTVAMKRVKPGLDDKSITSWNALMCSAYAQAWMAFGKARFRKIALGCADFLLGMMARDKRLFRIYKNGEVRIDGLLDDYAFLIEALINCYVISGEERYLEKAREFTVFALEHFGDGDRSMLRYSRNPMPEPLPDQYEILDNVIPASNSQMAHNLYHLSFYFNMPAWRERALKMLAIVVPELKAHGSGYSNWASLGLQVAYPFRQVAVVGKNVDDLFPGLYRHGVINAIFALSPGESGLPLLKDRFVKEKTLIYVCENETCGLPAETIEEALNQLA